MSMAKGLGKSILVACAEQVIKLHCINICILLNKYCNPPHVCVMLH